MNPTDTAASHAWPGAFGIYKTSRDAIRKNFWLLAAVWVVVFGASIGTSSLRLGLLGSLLSAAVNITASVMMVRLMLAGVDGKQLSADDLFRADLPKLALKMFGLQLLVGLVTVVSLLLFIVPFFFVVPRLSLAQYYLVDKDMGIGEAYWASWNNTKGNVGKVWGIIGLGLLIALIMLSIIGIPFGIYFAIMYSAAFAVLYRFICK